MQVSRRINELICSYLVHKLRNEPPWNVVLTFTNVRWDCWRFLFFPPLFTWQSTRNLILILRVSTEQKFVHPTGFTPCPGPGSNLLQMSQGNKYTQTYIHTFISSDFCLVDVGPRRRIGRQEAYPGVSKMFFLTSGWASRCPHPSMLLWHGWMLQYGREQDWVVTACGWILVTTPGTKQTVQYLIWFHIGIKLSNQFSQGNTIENESSPFVQVMRKSFSDLENDLEHFQKVVFSHEWVTTVSPYELGTSALLKEYNFQAGTHKHLDTNEAPQSERLSYPRTLK